ncbi:aldo/keto reductase [Nocardiopsis xinjiangensis]|uniref:aldo/keto reductase n=1 Tax=Nocardiopsis xinjiangensis TaxID=124285 RepID=UPI0003492308|nr:aldo/keto reductase [Nocardiopsis xinjiangensis]
MRTRTIGGRAVSAVGLGAMPLSRTGSLDPDLAMATVHAALDAGVRLIDTADAYHLDGSDPGHNEFLVAEALRARPGDASDVMVATKGGHTRDADGGWGVNGRPDHIKRACEDSLRRLGVETIDLYQHHRPDPAVPYEDTIGAFGELLDEGKVAMVGISNADPAQIVSADRVLGGRLAAVQNEFSPDFRSSEPELELCAERGIAFLPWSPFGGSKGAGGLSERHPVLAQVGERLGASSHQVCLAWMLAKSPVMIPIPGASRPESVRSSAVAADLELSEEDFALVDAEQPVAHS